MASDELERLLTELNECEERNRALDAHMRRLRDRIAELLTDRIQERELHQGQLT